MCCYHEESLNHTGNELKPKGWVSADGTSNKERVSAGRKKLGTQASFSSPTVEFSDPY